MVRRYILFGLLISGFLPVYINAAEDKTAETKPVILIVTNGTLFMAGDLFQHLNDLVAGLVGRNFNVRSIPIKEVFSRDLSGELSNVNYVLIVDTLLGFDEKDLIKLLIDTGLNKVDHKAYVLLSQLHPFSKLKELSKGFKKMFEGGTYQLFWQDKLLRFFANNDYESFENFLQRSLLERFQQGLLPSLREQEQRVRESDELQKKLDAFYGDLNRMNPGLAKQYHSLIGKLQSQIGLLQRKVDQLERKVDQLQVK